MTAPTAPRRRPDGRYDQPSLLGQRFLAVMLGGLFIGLLVVGGYLLFQRFTGIQVRGNVTGYEVTSDRSVVIGVEVSKTKGATAYCVVRARNRAGEEVGRDVAVLDAVGTQERTVRGTFTLATTDRPVTGELAGCRAEPLTPADITPRDRTPASSAP